MDADLSSALDEIRARNEALRTRYGYVGGLIELAKAKDDVPRLTAAVEAALKHHERIPLYGCAATEDEPDACPHDPDSMLHFEADDGSGEWLCEGKPEGAVCSTCIDGEGGERVEWPCDEYQAILAALKGDAGDSAQPAQ